MMMSRIGIVLVACSLSFPLSGSAFAQTQPPARDAQAEALRLLSVMHADANATKLIDGLGSAIIKQLAQMNPQLAQERVTKIVNEIVMPSLKSHIHEGLVLISRIWAEHFTADELRALEEFYSQPLGQKLIAEQPQIAVESFRVGGEWGRRVATEALQSHADELRKRGLNI